MNTPILRYKPKPYPTGVNNPNSRKINAYDLEGNYLKSFDNTIDAVRELFPDITDYSKIRSKAPNIYATCRGRSNSAYGYKWEYADNTDNTGGNR